MLFGSRANLYTQPYAISPGGSYSYAAAVQLIPNLIQYLQLTETSGTTAADSGVGGCPGAYINSPTLADIAGPGATMGSAPKFVVASRQYVNAFSAALASAFSGQAGTMAVWAKVSGSNIWTDNLYHTLIDIRVGSTNAAQINKSSSGESPANGVDGYHVVGATSKKANGAAQSTAWFHIAMSYDRSANALKLYVNGAQVGSTATALGNWTTTINNAALAVQKNDTQLTLFWSGWLAHYCLFARALTDAEITTLATAF